MYVFLWHFWIIQLIKFIAVNNAQGPLLGPRNSFSQLPGILAADRTHIITCWEFPSAKGSCPSQGAVRVQLLTGARYKGFLPYLDCKHLWRSISASAVSWHELMPWMSAPEFEFSIYPILPPSLSHWCGSLQHSPIKLSGQIFILSQFFHFHWKIYFIWKVTWGRRHLIHIK